MTAKKQQGFKMAAKTNSAATFGLIICTMLMSTAQGVTLEFYVSAAGSDANPGTNARPFATITRARDEIRKARSEQTPARGATVWIRQGSYNLAEPIVFKPQDSGSPGAVITYAAYQSEDVTLRGGLPLKAEWKPYAGGIYFCSLASTPLEDKEMTQLFCNGRRMVRARYPNWDFENPLRNGTGYFLCEDGDLAHISWRPGQLGDRKDKWRNPQTGIVHCFHSRNWGNMQYRIKGVDFGKRSIIFGEGGWQCQRRIGPGKGRGSSSPYYIENIFEELDVPHEWFLDTEKNLLYFHPPAGVDINKAKIELTTLPRLIEFRGSPENPVHHINIRGLHLTQSQTTFMDEYEDLGRGDWAIHRGGAVYFLGAENCRVEDCRIEQVGGNGIFLDGYNRNVDVTGCLIEDVGESAVCFVGSAKAVRHFMTWSNQGRGGEIVTDLTPGPKSPDYPADCSVSNSILRNVGVYGKQTSAVIVSKAMGIKISHCTIYGIPRAGITFNDGTWGGHVLEHCDIWDTVMETGEHGPFNGWGRDRFWSGLKKDLVFLDAVKTVHIRNNRISNLRPAISAGNWTIDLDDGCSNYHIYNNLRLGSTLKLRDGYHRKVYNNIHVSAVPLGWHCWPSESEDVFEKNITVVAGAAEGKSAPTTAMIRAAGSMAPHPWGKRHVNNLWWNFNTSEFTVQAKAKDAVESWEQWQQLGYGAGSFFTDPEFIDPANGDYRVKSDSPALKLGFENFPMDRFGHEMTRIEPFGGEFEETTTVKLRPDARGGRVRYTLDGSAPTNESPLYEYPRTLSETTTICAQTFKDGEPVGFAARAVFTRVAETWRPSWYKCLLAGRWIGPETQGVAVRNKAAVMEWRGASLTDIIGGDMIDALGGHEHGVVVSQLDLDSVLYKKGLRQNDIIVGVNGAKTANLKVFRKITSRQKNRPLTFEIYRGYKKIEIRL
jgi:hypothetical protein